MNTTKRWSWTAALAMALLVAAPVTRGDVATEIRAYLDREGSDLPAKTAALECPGVGEVATKPFQCTGSLTDGRLIQVKGEVGSDGGIHLTQSLYSDAAPETIREFLRSRVVPAVASLQCPPERALGVAFDCEGSLADGSRFTVTAERNSQWTLEIGPIAYGVKPPSPLVRAVQSYGADFAPEVTSVSCPLTPTEKPEPVVCVATLVTGAVMRAKVTRLPDASFRAESEFPPHPMLKFVRGAAVAAAILGALLLIGGGIRLAMLNARSFVARVPFAASQEVTLDRPGDYVLELEAPRFSNATGFNYSLHDAATGQEVPLFPNLLRTQKSGLVNVRLGVRRFSLARPGTYRLQISIPPGRDVSRFNAVFGTSFLLQGFLAVMAMVAGGILFIVCSIAAMS